MTVIRVKGFKIFTDRHGKKRCYHRKTGIPIDLKRMPLGSAAFIAECSRIAAALHSDPDAPKLGTLGALIKAYRDSLAFKERLKKSTRNGYQRVFNYLQPIEDTPLERFTPPFIQKMQDKALESRGRWLANYVKKVLSLLFKWGRARGYIKENSAKEIEKIERPQGLPKQNRAWSDAERNAVLAAAPPHMLPAIGLMMFTGLGPLDTLILPRTAYKNGMIRTNRSKTGHEVLWPVIAPLKEILNHAPAHEASTLCANSRGRSWTTSGFGSSWTKLRIKLVKDGKIQPGLTLYGMRHTVAVILREADVSLRHIADALGQKTENMAQHYSSEADLLRTMEKLAVTLETELGNRKSAAVKPE